MSFFKTLFAVLIANVVLFVAILAGVAVTGVAVKLSKKSHIKDNSYLVVDIYGDVMSYDPPASIPTEILGDHPKTLHRILGNLEKAAVDDRIAGVILRVSTNNTLGYAMIEEIRGAIDGVQAAGKPVYAFGEYLDRKTLFLASACDSIFIPDVGEVQLVGMGVVHGFVKGTLEKLGIHANIHRIKDYKSAAEPILRKDMSPESKEMYGWMLDELWDMQLAAISADRGISREDLVRDMNHAVFTAEEAKEAGFVDAIVYWSDLKDRLKGDGDKLRSVSEDKYAKVTRGSLGLDGDRKIAVVHAQGFIGGRKSRVDPSLGPMMGHESVAAQLRKAADDDDVAAVVFRVDSGGGESLTSDIIGHEIERTAAVKPVVVSMVDVAASGGYSISYRATKMVADSMTITGSIGSISGKFNTAGMWNKVGMTFDWVTKGPNALFWSSRVDFTPEQRKRFEENHYDGFNQWVADIAKHRGMTFDEVMKLAEGRVWTGRQAKANGLIDDLGGIDRAIELAKEEAGIPPEEAVTRVDLPKKKGLVELIAGGDAGDQALGWVLYRFIHEDLAATVRMLASGRLSVWLGPAVD